VTPDWIGWIATATFLLSYGCKDQRKLRRVQALAAVLWAIYGTIIQAVPIVVANLLVAGVAVYSSFAGSKPGTHVTRAAEPDLSRTS
jgi:hypothetical protein